MSDTQRQSKADPVERFRKDIEAATKRLKESGGATTSALDAGIDTFLNAIGYGTGDSLPSVRSMRDDLADEWAQVTRGHGREYLGLKCGIRGIDDLLNGWDGLALLGAEPNIGKTVLLSQIGRGIVENDPGAAFVFFSFEMSVRSIMRREMVRASTLPHRILLQGSTDIPRREWPESERLAYKAWNERDRKNAFHARDKAKEDDTYRRTFIVGPEAVRSMNIAHRDPLGPMRDIVEGALAESGCERAFIGIDYLQRIPVDQSAARSDLDRDERTMEAVHSFQRSLKHPVLAIAEFRKADFAKTADARGSMADFAGSRRLAYSADTLVTMTSATDSDEPREAELNGYMERVRDIDLRVLKARDGGHRGKVALEFVIDRNLFREGKRK
jgi:replicative DNA helicase